MKFLLLVYILIQATNLALADEPHYCKKNKQTAEGVYKGVQSYKIIVIDEETVLAGDMFYSANEIYLRAPIYTNGHLLKLEAIKIYFEKNGRIEGYVKTASGLNGEDAKLFPSPLNMNFIEGKLAGCNLSDLENITPYSPAKKTKQQCEYFSDLLDLKSIKGHLQPNGMDGSDGCNGQSLPSPILISVDQVYGKPLIIGSGQNGGDGGSGGKGLQGFTGGAGHAAKAGCSGRRYPGGQGGQGTMGSRGGNGGNGGNAGAAIPVIFNFSWSETNIFSGIISQDGSQGRAGVPGINGLPGNGGAGGASARSGKCGLNGKRRSRPGGPTGKQGPINTKLAKLGKQGGVSTTPYVLPEELVSYINRKYKETTKVEGSTEESLRYNRTINLGLDEYIFR